MPKLTVHQRQVLGAVRDWKSVPEVVEFIYKSPHTRRNRSPRSLAVRHTLEAFRKRSWVKFSAGNYTYVATEKGLAIYTMAMRRGLPS